ncbi:hypothetical protein [Morganella morganii]|uniref:hypothetical protein n=1 Tax=Morganella morganii TaxID=582 RepID=UPI003EB908BF
MFNIKKVSLVLLFSTFSISSFAQSISAWGGTISEAELKIEKIANENNSKYMITSARMGNYAYIVAELIK